MTARSDYEHMLDAVRRQLHRNPQVTAVQQRMMSLNPGLWNEVAADQLQAAAPKIWIGNHSLQLIAWGVGGWEGGLLKSRMCGFLVVGFVSVDRCKRQKVVVSMCTKLYRDWDFPVFYVCICNTMLWTLRRSNLISKITGHISKINHSQ